MQVAEAEALGHPQVGAAEQLLARFGRHNTGRTAAVVTRPTP